MLDNGVLQNYINDLSMTGLTSNPSIFEAAIAKTSDYDSAIVNFCKESLLMLPCCFPQSNMRRPLWPTCEVEKRGLHKG